MDFKIGVLVTTTSQQAHSQLIVTIDDHRSIGQADKTSEPDACSYHLKRMMPIN